MSLLLLTILALGQLPGFHCTVTTVGDLYVLEGNSITVPCHYNPQYISHVKYWCYGRMREFCSSLARTDNPESSPKEEGHVTIADDPTQHVFTVTMRDLTEKDSGWYHCGVEVGGMWVADITASLYITVIQGISVLNSMISGDEGRSISVQCHYSKKLRSSVKKWCRSGDWNSCVVTDSEGIYSSRNVLIHDDRNSTFTVTLKQLEMRDSGWYWCAAGQQQVAVHVSVTPRATTLATLSPANNVNTTTWRPPVMNSSDSHGHRFWESPLMICGIMLLVMTGFFVLWRSRQQCKRKHEQRWRNEMSNNLTVCPLSKGDWKNTSVIFLNTQAQQAHMVQQRTHEDS